MHNSFYSFKSPQEESLATKRRLRLFAVCVVGGLLISYSAMAQGQTVSGRVTSKNQEPLPGVSILVKGSTIGTSTDADGKYTVQVPQQNGVLVFSFIGFATQEVSVGSQTQIDVQLSEDVTQLTEVVVTALGISQEKRSLGYSVQEVKGQDIAQTQRSNFLVSLQGRVAGLTMTPTSGLPGASASINLRGLNSLSGSNQPIIVVDGLVINNATFDQHRLVSDLDNRGNDYTNRGADINPNDIESITVLKGPEAAALYGQDGGSGAIIITT
ncbi:MAG: carboxypeptidase-like regulatory domain-containing protein, partial [Bacteroidota bacterium]